MRIKVGSVWEGYRGKRVRVTAVSCFRVYVVDVDTGRESVMKQSYFEERYAKAKGAGT